MNLAEQIAKHCRDVYFGGNWTSVNLKDSLADVDWMMATAKLDTLNTIATLVYHLHYYVVAVQKVLQNLPLDSKDEFSFNHPPIHNQKDWEAFLANVWVEAESFADAIRQLPENRFWDIFENEKYGTYYRNIQGITEHAHYHLGQIVLIKKMLAQDPYYPNYNGVS